MKRALTTIGGATLLLVFGGVAIRSTSPDGLEHVAERLGFAGRDSAMLSGSPLADYQTRWLGSSWASQASAGLVGVVLLYGFGLLLGRLVKRKK